MEKSFNSSILVTDKLSPSYYHWISLFENICIQPKIAMEIEWS